MSHDEVVRGGDDDESRSYGWLLIVAAAVVAALLSILGHHAKPVATPLPAPTLSPLPAPKPLPSAAASTAPDPPSHPPRTGLPSQNPTKALLSRHSGYIQLLEVCPVVTDRRTSVAVTVVLQNVTPVPETIEAVTPVLMTPGLRSAGVELQYGACDRRTGKPVPPKGNLLPAGGSALVTLRLALPHGCPAPYPVTAKVTVKLVGVVRQQGVAVFTNLGASTPDLCNRAAPG